MLHALKRQPPPAAVQDPLIAGIRSGTLSRLDRSSMELIVRGAFTSIQPRAILEENHHLFLGAHPPLLDERARIWLAA